MEIGKCRLADVLLQASTARLSCYPMDYVELAKTEEVEHDPTLWGKRACVAQGPFPWNMEVQTLDVGWESLMVGLIWLDQLTFEENE